MLLSEGLIPTAAGLSLLGGAFGLATTVASAWAGDVSPPGKRASGIAAAFAWRDVGIFAAVLSRGVFSAETTFAFFAAAYAVALLSAIGIPMSPGGGAAESSEE